METKLKISKKEKSNLEKSLIYIFLRVFKFLNYYKIPEKPKEEIIKLIKEYLIFLSPVNYVKTKKKFNAKSIIDFCDTNFEKRKKEWNNAYLILKKFISII